MHRVACRSSLADDRCSHLDSIGLLQGDLVRDGNLTSGPHHSLRLLPHCFCWHLAPLARIVGISAGCRTRVLILMMMPGLCGVAAFLLRLLLLLRLLVSLYGALRSNSTLSASVLVLCKLDILILDNLYIDLLLQ